MTEPSKPAPIEVFASYSHKDETLHDELAKHLKPVEREGIIQPWHDRRITAGRELEAEIDVVLNRAGIILLLVSPDFIASEYCWGKEMKRAMERHEAREARVIPIILRPVDWHKMPFGKLLALPTDGKAVTSWTNQDEALVDIAKGIRAAAADMSGAARKTPPLALELRGVAYTTQHRGAIIEVDIGNQSSSAHQITRCSLEVPSVGTTLEHAPGPSNLIGSAPWLPRVPIQLDPRKLTRGTLFFSAGMGPLKDGLPQEPLRAKLRLEFFLAPTIEQEVEIYTFDALRKMERDSQAASGSEGQQHTGARALSPEEKFRSAAERGQKELAQKQEEKERKETLERSALDAAPREFEALAELLQKRGESLNAEHLPGLPTLTFQSVNHRLDAGYTYSIELSPYAQMRSFTVTVRVGLHPNAAQAHAELPNVTTVSWDFRAHFDEYGFSWIDERRKKWSAEQIIDVALDRLTDLLLAKPDYLGGLDDYR